MPIFSQKSYFGNKPITQAYLNGEPLFQSVPDIEIGDYLEGGYFIGFVNYSPSGPIPRPPEDDPPKPTHGLVIAPKADRPQLVMDITGRPGFSSTYQNSWFDGAYNLQSLKTEIANAGRDFSDFEALHFCDNYVNDGYNDWYLPAVYEIAQFCFNHPLYLYGTNQWDETASSSNKYPFVDSIPLAWPTIPNTRDNAPWPQTTNPVFSPTGPQSLTAGYNWLSTHQYSAFGRESTKPKGAVGPDGLTPASGKPVSTYHFYVHNPGNVGYVSQSQQSNLQYTNPYPIAPIRRFAI